MIVTPSKHTIRSRWSRYSYWDIGRWCGKRCFNGTSCNCNMTGTVQANRMTTSSTDVHVLKGYVRSTFKNKCTNCIINRWRTFERNRIQWIHSIHFTNWCWCTEVSTLELECYCTAYTTSIQDTHDTIQCSKISCRTDRVWACRQRTSTFCCECEWTFPLSRVTTAFDIEIVRCIRIQSTQGMRSSNVRVYRTRLSTNTRPLNKSCRTIFYIETVCSSVIPA